MTVQYSIEGSETFGYRLFHSAPEAKSLVARNDKEAVAESSQFLRVAEKDIAFRTADGYRFDYVIRPSLWRRIFGV